MLTYIESMQFLLLEEGLSQHVLTWQQLSRMGKKYNQKTGYLG